MSPSPDIPDAGTWIATAIWLAGFACFVLSDRWCFRHWCRKTIWGTSVIQIMMGGKGYWLCEKCEAKK